MLKTKFLVLKENFNFYKCISFIFNPIFLAFTLFIILVSEYNIRTKHIAIISIIQIVIPVSYFIYGLIKKNIDFDLTERQKRIPFMLATLATSLISSYFLLQWKYYKILNIVFPVIIIVAIALLITLKWKISLHSLTNTVFLVVLGKYFDKYIYLAIPFIIPLISISRYKLKKHTIAQLIAGVLVGFSYLIINYYIYFKS